jgi:predicted acyltransferase
MAKMTTPQRDQSLDAFRGLTVMLMVIVNIQGNGDDAFFWLKHAEWNGLTLADLVFPWFLFIVGLSAPLALERPGQAQDWARIIRRTALLFLIGVILAWLIRPRFEFADIRMAGVLQRIAIVYLACALIMAMKSGWKWPAAAALALMLLHGLMLLFVPAPGASLPSLDPGGGIAGWLDQQLLPGRIYRKTWDPEGVLSTLSATGSALLGVAMMRWMKAKVGPVQTMSLAAVVLALIISGLVVGFALPFNKALWTPSFTLFTAGLGLLLWVGLRAVWPIIGQNAFAKLAVLMGETALTFYILHMLLLALLVRKLPSDMKIWEVTYGWLTNTGLHGGWAALTYALIAAALCIAPLGLLKRNGWLVKV